MGTGGRGTQQAHLVLCGLPGLFVGRWHVTFADARCVAQWRPVMIATGVVGTALMVLGARSSVLHAIEFFEHQHTP